MLSDYDFILDVFRECLARPDDNRTRLEIADHVLTKHRSLRDIRAIQEKLAELKKQRRNFTAAIAHSTDKRVKKLCEEWLAPLPYQIEALEEQQRMAKREFIQLYGESGRQFLKNTI